MSKDVNGGGLVLYSVAAAIIRGTSPSASPLRNVQVSTCIFMCCTQIVEGQRGVGRKKVFVAQWVAKKVAEFGKPLQLTQLVSGYDSAWNALTET